MVDRNTRITRPDMPDGRKSDSMRSSNKSRSRNKNSNRNRGVGNVVNRVFDSAGPEGRVRGTPQQIIEKYQTLARDAQLSGDRVATESFQQHAEHYIRLLNEAQREMAERQEQQQQQQQKARQQREDQDGNDQNNDRGDKPRSNSRPNGDSGQNGARKTERPAMDAMDVSEDDEAPALVETPESGAPKRPRTRTRRPAAELTESKEASPQDEGQPFPQA